MHLLTWHLLPASLYSIKVPFTYQSSLVYPLPPPSTLKGLLANSLQRWEGIGPLEALREVEAQVRFAGAIPLEPIVLRDHIVSTVVKVGGSGKATDALSRQFAFTPRLGAVMASDTALLVQRLATALPRTAVYLGDSESLVTCAQVEVEEVRIYEAAAGTALTLRMYVPVPVLEGYSVDRDIYWVQTECWKPQHLRPYLFPLQRQGHYFLPATITGRLTQAVELTESTRFGPLVVPTVGPAPTRRRRRGRRRKE